MAKSAAKVRRASHLPEQPGQALSALGGFRRQKGAELLREVKQDRAGFEDTDRLGPLRSTKAGIFELGLMATKPLPNCWPLLILISQASYSAPLFAERQKLLEHNCDLLAVRRPQRIELKRDGGRPAAPCRGSGRRLGG